MNINSIFKDRLYNLPVSSNPSKAERKIVSKILDSCGIKTPESKTSLLYVEEDYDFYTIKDDVRGFDLKFSLDHESKNFLREIKNVKSCKSQYSPKYVKSDTIKVGDKICFLLCESDLSESLFDYGRSILPSNLTLFCDCYADFASNSNYRTLYKTIVKESVMQSDMDQIFDEDQKEFIEDNSDYQKCKTIVDQLKSEILDRVEKLPKLYTGNILGDMSKNSIFTSGDQFLFKDLRFACKGHIYSDIANIVLFYGFNTFVENELLKTASEKCGIELNKNLYRVYYELELRRMALYYLLQYLKEVYVYESMRVETIIQIIDSFSQSYKRLCKIPIFKEHRKFILRNITEPVFDRRVKD